MRNAGQSKSGSFVEAMTNIFVGVTVAFVSQQILFHFYGIPIPLTLNMKLTAWFTAVSLARSFLLRRLFNHITTRQRGYYP